MFLGKFNAKNQKKWKTFFLEKMLKFSKNEKILFRKMLNFSKKTKQKCF